MRITTRQISYSAIIAVLYAAVTLLFAPISYGALQFRISEGLMLLAAFTPAAVPGLYLGCVIANLLGGFGIIDILFGGLATLLAAYCTYKISQKTAGMRNRILKVFLLPLPTIIFNGLIVGGYLPFVITDPGIGDAGLAAVIAVSVLSVSMGEAVVTYAVGLPLYYAIKRTAIFGNDGIRDIDTGG
mgnify:CR=1 FL=1